MLTIVRSYRATSPSEQPVAPEDFCPLGYAWQSVGSLLLLLLLLLLLVVVVVK
jgi:hypothetical protein